jgi:Lar family restriction alleviation protein
MSKSEKTGYHPCPFCGSEDIEIVSDRDFYRMKCRDCCAVGPTAARRTAAIYIWNNRSESPLKNVAETQQDSDRK